MNDDNNKSFWTTLPGILTGIAALLTAIGGIWVIYHDINDVDPPTIESFGANPEKIVSGKSATLSWRVSNAISVIITPEIGDVPLSGSRTVSPTQTTTYTLIATNEAGTKQATTVVSLETNEVPATVPVITSFQASPEKIVSGKSATLSWSVLNAENVTITPGVGDVPLNGSRTISPTQTTTYTLTATNEAGTKQATTVVSVETNDVPTNVQSYYLSLGK
jgi:hypothetical protein